jgi:hypothetical protein
LLLALAVVILPDVVGSILGGPGDSALAPNHATMRIMELLFAEGDRIVGVAGMASLSVYALLGFLVIVFRVRSEMIP